MYYFYYLGCTSRDHEQVMSTASAADPHTGGLVSIMVMYRPPPSSGSAAHSSTPAKSLDQPPPTYESLFTGDRQPGRLTTSLLCNLYHGNTNP